MPRSAPPAPALPDFVWPLKWNMLKSMQALRGPGGFNRLVLTQDLRATVELTETEGWGWRGVRFERGIVIVTLRRREDLLDIAVSWEEAKALR